MGLRARARRMRRAVQFQFEHGGKGPLEQADVDGALEEMLFSGGALNRKLLGGASAELGFAAETRAPFSRVED